MCAWPSPSACGQVWMGRGSLLQGQHLLCEILSLTPRSLLTRLCRFLLDLHKNYLKEKKAEHVCLFSLNLISLPRPVPSSLGWGSLVRPSDILCCLLTLTRTWSPDVRSLFNWCERHRLDFSLKGVFASPALFSPQKLNTRGLDDWHLITQIPWQTIC